jgi:hypothetical protein
MRSPFDRLKQQRRASQAPATFTVMFASRSNVNGLHTVKRLLKFAGRLGLKCLKVIEAK